MQAIHKLEQLGFSLWLEEGNIKYRLQGRDRPAPTVVKPLLEELKARKSEALAFLQARGNERQAKNQAREPAEVVDFASEAAKVKAALSRQSIAAIQSDTLGETVCWARDKKEASKAPPGAVVYTLDELKELAKDNPTREGLRRIHQAKKLFNGRIVKNTNNPFEEGD